jgi:hypothetical protein
LLLYSISAENKDLFRLSAEHGLGHSLTTRKTADSQDVDLLEMQMI